MKLINIILILFLSTLLLISIGCTNKEIIETNGPNLTNNVDTTLNNSVVENEVFIENNGSMEIVVPEVVELICEDSSNCDFGEHCIENVCAKLSTVYDTESECSVKCNFNEVEISTSDGEHLTLPRGQGSYTSAGAIEWKLMSSADYCKGDTDTPVAIRLLKKNYGEIIGDEVIIVDVGIESESITHPTINTLNFKLTVDSINEICS